MRHQRDGLSSEHVHGSAAWTISGSRGLRLHVLTRVRGAPWEAQRTHECRLSSPTAADGKVSRHRRVFARPGDPLRCTETSALLIVSQSHNFTVSQPRSLTVSQPHKLTVSQPHNLTVSLCPEIQGDPRPSRRCSSQARGKKEASRRAEEGRKGGGPAARRESEERSGAAGRGEKTWRACSSMARKRERPVFARQPNTAPAHPHTEHGDQAQLAPDTPSCRVVWRLRRAENCAVGATPILHLYLPHSQLSDVGGNATAEHSSSENDKRLDNKAKEQQDITGTSQRRTKGQQQQNITTLQRQRDTTSDQKNTTARDEEHGTGNRKEYDIMAQPAITEDEQIHRKDDGKQDVTEGKQRHDITQGTPHDIIDREESKPNGTRHDDITQACDAVEGGRQQGCSGNSSSDDMNGTIPRVSRTELDKADLPQTFTEKQERRHQRIVEKRGNVTPGKPGFRGVRVRAARTWSPNSEAQSPQRKIQPLPTVLFPFAVMPTATHTPLLTRALPSVYGTVSGYRVGMFHIPELFRAKTQTTGASFVEREIKTTKKVPRCPETTGNHCASNMGIRGTAEHRPEIMSSEWGTLPRKVKTTKTFVWGPWGPQETKSVYELHTPNNRCQSSD
ncbi:hypothetical protein P4O66_017474 [Electrophorus voltai]|uniref:Uncharacterized protein n=1 Tax=Electrophorus voltai TaxID=2609070 RepID=A0AAD9DPG4_9TELE|nr:hypothetical protein P4O66_017474 [Electrophorus voltai]